MVHISTAPLDWTAAPSVRDALTCDSSTAAASHLAGFFSMQDRYKRCCVCAYESIHSIQQPCRLTGTKWSRARKRRPAIGITDERASDDPNTQYRPLRAHDLNTYASVTAQAQGGLYRIHNRNGLFGLGRARKLLPGTRIKMSVIRARGQRRERDMHTQKTRSCVPVTAVPRVSRGSSEVT